MVSLTSTLFLISVELRGSKNTNTVQYILSSCYFSMYYVATKKLNWTERSACADIGCFRQNRNCYILCVLLVIVCDSDYLKNPKNISAIAWLAHWVQYHPYSLHNDYKSEFIKGYNISLNIVSSCILGMNCGGEAHLDCLIVQMVWLIV